MPKARAAHLVAQGLSAAPVVSPPTQVQARPVTPPPHPSGLRQLMPGRVAASAPHHLKLMDELADGATLREQARDVWQLTSADGQTRKIDSRTVFSLLSKGVLEGQP